LVTSKNTLNLIKRIVDNNYNRLAISVLGNGALTDTELKQLKESGVDVSNQDSLMSMVYHYNYINHPAGKNSPITVEDMKNQQRIKDIKPDGIVHKYSEESTNDKMKQFIDKMKVDVGTRLISIVRQNNDSYKVNSIQNPNRSLILDELMKESTLGDLRQKLQDTSGDGNRDWMRVATTEISNIIGIASADRIVTDNVDKDLDDVFVFRIIVNDAKTCKYCRRFYLDSDETPKVYRLSTLLANGSNYGKKTDDWHPCVGATHPNERCSQTIELKPGWVLNTGGSMAYTGLDKWRNYIFNKLSS